jgi:hypothetical protein
VVLCCYAANIGRNETDLEIWSDFVDLLFNKKTTNQDENKMVLDLYENLEKNTKA